MLVPGPVVPGLDRVSCCQEHGVTLERVFLSCALVLMFLFFPVLETVCLRCYLFLYAHVSMSRVCNF